MVELEFRLDSITHYGAAVFGTSGLERRWYVMTSLDDNLHEFNHAKDHLQHPKGIEALDYEKGKIFRTAEEAVRYVRAVVYFDKLVWFIDNFFVRGDTSVSADLKRKAVDDYKQKIAEEGLREILEGIPGLKDIVRFLDMPPEEVASEMWRVLLSR